MLTKARKIHYPTSDGKPMAETERHRDLMFDLLKTLKAHYVDIERVCVSGNMLMYYQEGNKRKHVSPDVFVVRGVEKRERENYLIWEEGKGPEVVIELTSSSTKKEDTEKKFKLYRDVLKVREYFLFDPKRDYLTPRLQGYRLVKGQYRPIRAMAERLPSLVLGLHLEADDNTLRLWNPTTKAWLPTLDERIGTARERAQKEQTRRQQAEARIAQLETQLAQLLKQKNGGK